MPQLIYFQIAGRGELIRLIAQVGGVELTESTEMPEGVTTAECGSSGSLPILIDGDLKMNESTAIEYYVASIAPKFKDLTPTQRAKDAQFCSLKETLLTSVAKVMFSTKDKDELIAAINKHWTIMEGIIPGEGFINGLTYPTAADLAVVIICEAYMPFLPAYKIAEIDLGAKFPKLKALNDRTLAVEEVAKAVNESTTLKTAAFGL